MFPSCVKWTQAFSLNDASSLLSTWMTDGDPECCTDIIDFRQRQQMSDMKLLKEQRLSAEEVSSEDEGRFQCKKNRIPLSHCRTRDAVVTMKLYKDEEMNWN